MIGVGEFLIALREGFEAALIISIIYAHLRKLKARSYSPYLWYGSLSAVLIGITAGVTVWLLYGAMPSKIQMLFEAGAAWTATVVLSSVIYWMAVKAPSIKEIIEQNVTMLFSRREALGLSFFAFTVVFREAIETVLFLTPFIIHTPTPSLTGAILGILFSIALSYGIYVVGMKLNIKRFFYVTSLLLIFLAGGLAGYGTHEFIEYAEKSGINLGWLAENAYELPIHAGDPLHHKGIIGSIFAVMFGYSTSAEWLRLIVHVSYLIIALPLILCAYHYKLKTFQS